MSHLEVFPPNSLHCFYFGGHFLTPCMTLGAENIMMNLPSDNFLSGILDRDMATQAEEAGRLTLGEGPHSL